MPTIHKAIPKVLYVSEVPPGDYVPLAEYRQLESDNSAMKEYNKLREEYIAELKFDIESLRADLHNAEDKLVTITEVATEQSGRKR